PGRLPAHDRPGRGAESLAEGPGPGPRRRRVLRRGRARAAASPHRASSLPAMPDGLPPGVGAAPACGHLRPLRRRALPARRRQRSHGAPSARRLRAADRPAARLLPWAWPAVERDGRGQRALDRRRHPARRHGGAMIELKSAREIGLMRRGGHILSEVMDRLRTSVKPGMSTLEIDTDVEEFIRARGAVPAFKGYRGFPATVCISINEEVV